MLQRTVSSRCKTTHKVSQELTRQALGDQPSKDALRTRTHTLNTDERIDVERRRLVDDREQRHVWEADIPDGDGVRPRAHGEHVVVVHNRIDADPRPKVQRGCPRAGDVGRARGAHEFACLGANCALVARELERRRPGVEDDAHWLGRGAN